MKLPSRLAITNRLPTCGRRCGRHLVDVANKRQLDEYSKSVIDIMVAGSKVKFPPVLLSNEVHDMMRDLDMRLREQRMTLDDYMRMTGITHDKMHEEFEPRRASGCAVHWC